MPEHFVTPPELAKVLGVAPEKVLRFIRAGHLAAVNLATPGRNQRPRYSISPEAVQDFLRRRTVGPPLKPTTRRRKEVAGDYY